MKYETRSHLYCRWRHNFAVRSWWNMPEYAEIWRSFPIYLDLYKAFNLEMEYLHARITIVDNLITVTLNYHLFKKQNRFRIHNKSFVKISKYHTCILNQTLTNYWACIKRAWQSIAACLHTLIISDTVSKGYRGLMHFGKLREKS